MSMIFGQSLEYTIIFTLLSCTGLLCNLILLVCMIKDPLRAFRNPSSYLIANLAIGDMETCIGQLVVHVLSLSGHVETAEVVFKNGITFFGPDLSCMCLVSLAVERYFCITRPIIYRVRFTATKSVCLILVIWFLHISRIVAINVCIPKGIVQLKDVKLYTLLLYAVSVLFCLICNIATLCFMKRKERQGRALQESTGTQPESQDPRTRSQRRLVVTMVIVTSCIVVTIVPFTILMFLSNFQDFQIPAEVIETVRMTYFLNFVINPALYFWRMARYRKSIINVLSCRKTP